MQNKLAAVAATGALSTAVGIFSASTALAGSVTQPGETRGWFRMVIPLWTPPALPRKPLITKG